jgi:acyl carrier protein
MVETNVSIRVDDVPAVVQELVRVIAPERVTHTEPDHRLIEDLGYHSLVLAELRFTVEDLFGIESLGAEAAAAVERVADILAVVDRCIEAREGELPDIGAVDALFSRYGVASPVSR